MAERSQPSARIQKLRERKERHKQRHRAYRVVVGVAGGSLVLAGIILSLPFVPGPGLVLVALGLGLLALEFDRAERLLEKVVDRLEQMGEQAKRASPVTKAIGAGAGVAAVAAFVAAALLWDLPVVPF